MKFQNPSVHGFRRTDGCMDTWMHGQPETNMPRQLL